MIDWHTIRSALVIAPHPDDEVIAAFGLICRLRQRGVAVRVVVVTDGAASHRQSRRFPPERLAAARRDECRAGMARAGVRSHRIRFLGHPDSGLADYSVRQRQALARELTRGPAPDLLIAPSIDDHHADHQVVANATRSARFGCRRRLAYIVWPRADRSAPPTRLQLTLSDRRWHMKRAALACHATQNGRIDDDPSGFCISRAERLRFTRPVERFVHA